MSIGFTVVGDINEQEQHITLLTLMMIMMNVQQAELTEQIPHANPSKTLTTTFVTAIVWGEFRFPPHDEGVALLGVLRSAGLCKGTIEGSLSCQAGRLASRLDAN